ncbi:unnamed protein product [Porites evermanni]|uniref:Uncharacterized protein n=1 Tax=Porites evermanni TaxID=104178 RepID=A0ABN8RZ54_9CNID|nr:unnamed protein product [Porites evermanni]
MELRGFFATVFAFLFTVEVYSHSRTFYYAGFGLTNSDRYMIITDKCENKNSQRECSAMANGDTGSKLNTHFTLERNTSRPNKLRWLRCISFNNTYSLMVQGNNVSFVNVSCEKENKNVWFKFKRLPGGHHGFFIRGSTMCLTRSWDGNLSVVNVNSTNDRKCHFKQEIVR